MGSVTETANTSFSGGVDGSNTSDELVTIDTGFFDIPAGQEVSLLLQNGMAADQYIYFRDTGNISKEFVLGGGSAVFGVADNSGNVKLLSSPLESHPYKTATALGTFLVDDLNGTYNGVTVGAPTASIVGDRTGSLH